MRYHLKAHFVTFQLKLLLSHFIVEKAAKTPIKLWCPKIACKAKFKILKTVYITVLLSISDVSMIIFGSRFQMLISQKKDPNIEIVCDIRVYLNFTF